MGGGFGAKVVESLQRQIMAVSMKKSGLGVPVLGGACGAFCSIAHTGVGDYLITFTHTPWDQIPEIFAQIKTVNAYAQVGTVSTLSVQILTKNLDTDAALEADFDLLVMGCLARDLVGP